MTLSASNGGVPKLLVPLNCSDVVLGEKLSVIMACLATKVIIFLTKYFFELVECYQRK